MSHCRLRKLSGSGRGSGENVLCCRRCVVGVGGWIQLNMVERVGGGSDSEGGGGIQWKGWGGGGSDSRGMEYSGKGGGGVILGEGGWNTVERVEYSGKGRGR